ncbi:2Fe-2S iron-sulfur cluster-binding protein [Pseudofrankia sp. BMG5.37]|uniref:2Fe-2S iron-sulfur cluster-binding protein n=1 Tax=Pseudofrankia sp. BMG5.37 TaxID=3050035 RepID=UPI002895D067|nr:2Fe-2S iron-sulfur cluster-binding protein [Pseudofrankia sp. BMG5.37]MDT3442833.1 2Fe-2S iron-sulfur cluster-binding protein [Pseudofrankia sp. BMG5.37]
MTEQRGGRRRGPVVHVDPIGADLELEPGETIIEGAWRLGYHWPTVCYGQARCTVCHVEVLRGAEHLTPADDEEQDALEHQLPGAHRRDLTRLRLACRARATGDVAVRKNGVRPGQALPASQSVHVVNEPRN